MEDIVI